MAITDEIVEGVTLEAVRTLLHALRVVREECSGHGRITIIVTPERVDELEIVAKIRARPLEAITHPPGDKL